MITMQQFVVGARDEVRRNYSSLELHKTAALVECDNATFDVWTVDYAPYSEGVRGYAERSPFVAAVYPDGSAQLLSRDEDECRLFATLWELGK